MLNPEITTPRIIQLLSKQWLTLNGIVEGLQIKELQDKRYLAVKLKELHRKEKIVYIFYIDDIYWKINKPEFQDLEVPSFYLYTDFYREFLDNNPEDIKAWRELGYWYGSIQQYNEAIRCFEAMIDLDPTDAEIWRLLGDSYNEQLMDKEAILCYKNALKLLDTEINLGMYLMILYNLGGLYERDGNYKKALKTFKLLYENKEEFSYFDHFIDQEHIEISIESLEEVLADKRDEDISFEDSELPTSVIYDISQLKLFFERHFEKQNKLSEDRNIILQKSFIQTIIKPYFDRPSKKQLKKLEDLLDSYKDGWPDELWKSFVKEYRLTIERYKTLQPSKWKKWGKRFLDIISKFPIFL